MVSSIVGLPKTTKYIDEYSAFLDAIVENMKNVGHVHIVNKDDLVEEMLRTVARDYVRTFAGELYGSFDGT